MINLGSYACTFCLTLLLVVSCADTDEYDYEYSGDLQGKGCFTRY